MAATEASRPDVLVVDDDEHIRRLVRLYLERDGYRVTEAADGDAALQLAKQTHPRLIVLDLMMPGMDGLDACRALHVESMVPIIMLTARVEEVDRLEGLGAGADDYVTKPFSPAELAARVRAVLRRTDRDGAVAAHPLLSAGGISIDLRTREASVRGVAVRLTPTEFRLLTMLLQEPDRIFSRDDIIERAFGYDFDGFDRTVDAHVSSLRRKMESTVEGAGRHINTVYGSGYRLLSAEG